MVEKEVPQFMSTNLLRIFRYFYRSNLEVFGPRMGKRVSLNEEKQQDGGDSSGDEEVNQYDHNEYAVPVAQMSMALRRALGLENIGQEDDVFAAMAAKSDWKAPKEYGLRNSKGTMQLCCADDFVWWLIE